MPAWYLTIDTPLGEKHAVVRGQQLKTAEDAKADYQQRQGCRGSLGNVMAHQGEIIDCIPAEWPKHFKGRSSALDAAYPAPLTREQLLK